MELKLFKSIDGFISWFEFRHYATAVAIEINENRRRLRLISVTKDKKSVYFEEYRVRRRIPNPDDKKYPEWYKVWKTVRSNMQELFKNNVPEYSPFYNHCKDRLTKVSMTEIELLGEIPEYPVTQKIQWDKISNFYKELKNVNCQGEVNNEKPVVCTDDDNANKKSGGDTVSIFTIETVYQYMKKNPSILFLDIENPPFDDGVVCEITSYGKFISVKNERIVRGKVFLKDKLPSKKMKSRMESIRIMTNTRIRKFFRDHIPHYSYRHFYTPEECDDMVYMDCKVEKDIILNAKGTIDWDSLKCWTLESILDLKWAKISFQLDDMIYQDLSRIAMPYRIRVEMPLLCYDCKIEYMLNIIEKERKTLLRNVMNLISTRWKEREIKNEKKLGVYKLSECMIRSDKVLQMTFDLKKSK